MKKRKQPIFSKEKQEAIDRFFYRTPLRWIRRRDYYFFDNEEMELSIDYYLKTGKEP